MAKPSADVTAPREFVESVSCCDDAWELAYRRFETPEQEIRKFMRRLQQAGALDWPRDARVLELFCGRGNGLVALERLGFQDLQGVDLSLPLLREYRGPAQCSVADCRQLPFDDQTCQRVVIQGGLHHLPSLPNDLEQVVREIHRVLQVGGQVLIVEPWKTPFLDFVHAVCRRRWARQASARIDALATMIERERETYENWLSRPQEVLTILRGHFAPRHERVRWGKLVFVGVKDDRH